MAIDSTRSATPSDRTAAAAQMAKYSSVPAVSTAAQLSCLSAVLNSLQEGATAATKKIVSFKGTVELGVYAVQPQLISSRIVGEALSAR